MGRRSYLIILAAVLIVLIALPVLVAGQSTGVTAEALGQANLRAIPDVNSDLVGEIQNGTVYPVIGRSEFYPWVLLGDPQTERPIGWVFNDLVTITGNLSQVPFSRVDIRELPDEVPTVATEALGDTGASGQGDASTPEPTLTATATPDFAVIGTVRGEINIRYGPGTNYPILGRARTGEIFEVTGYHTQFPWLRVAYEDSPTNEAWIANDLLDLDGDRFSLPAITATTFNLPELTPTPVMLQAVNSPGREPVELSPEFAALGETIWNQVLESGFVPGTSAFGALYLHDLQTGEAITFGNEIAFSGTSINKVGLLLSYFGMLDREPNLQQAADIANTMICSENVATNRLLGDLANGDQLQGAEDMTAQLVAMGLEKTFLTAPYFIPSNNTPTPPPRVIRYPQTSADQVSANPNPTNQMTVDEMGWVLGAMYECAYQEGGPLIENFGDAFTPQECRKALHVMTNNTVDALLKAGVPEEIPVAHKHGWVDDTHGNAALFFTPGGDYVLVMMLHRPGWMLFTESLPVIAEVSRTVYNHYNPDQPLDEVREGYIPGTDECNYTFEDELVTSLTSPFFLDSLEPMPIPDVDLPFIDPEGDSPEATEEVAAPDDDS